VLKKAGIAAACLVVLLAAVGLILRGHGPVSPVWIEFAIGPASGESLHVNPTTFRGDGATLKVAIATAHDIPAVRVIGPPWLAETRYAIRAAVGDADEKQFRAMFREELTRHLNLRVHREMREFDVLLLRTAGAVRLERAVGRKPSISVGRRDAQLRNSSLADLARTLQTILGKPVLDRTGLADTYNLRLDWDDEPVSWLTGALRDRFGIEMTPARESLEVLVIDDVRLDAGMRLLDRVGRLTRFAPQKARWALAHDLTIR
jgi:uncharacterized protein (TIGR03435 family)